MGHVRVRPSLESTVGHGAQGGFIDVVTCEERFEGGKGVSHVPSSTWGRVFQAKAGACAKALQREYQEYLEASTAESE